MIKVSKSPNKNWRNNAIQFPRLIAELEAVDGFTPRVLEELSAEMDLSIAQISTIIDRAQRTWDDIKDRTAGVKV